MRITVAKKNSIKFLKDVLTSERGFSSFSETFRRFKKLIFSLSKRFSNFSFAKDFAKDLISVSSSRSSLASVYLLYATEAK